MSFFTRTGVLYLLLALLLASASGGLAAQDPILEEETNHPCGNAQPLGEPSLPFSIVGSLDSTESEPDVDFFRVEGVSGQYLDIRLEGASTGMGDLGDPYLGFFDGDCQLIASNDDDGATLNSRLLVQVPDSGEYVLAATVCCDWQFLGGGIGSYTLSVSPAVLIGHIAGRAVDADTLEPLPGDAPPFAWAGLYRCNEYGCNEWANSVSMAGDGTFMFTLDYMGRPLTAGTYAVDISAQWYDWTWTEPFEVGEGEELYLGDILVNPVALIGSISGRLVDALDGFPLTGYSPPYAFVELERCEEWGCYIVAGGIYTDDQGIFFIDGRNYGVTPGVFRVLAQADDYYPLATDLFELGDKESVDFGDLALTPLPIAFGDVSGCDVLPMGGQCYYTVQIHNRGEGRYRGEAWSIVRYFSQTFPNRWNRFQVGRVGAQNPNPLRVSLAHDGWTTLEFRLDIPESVAEGTTICVSVNVGRDPDPQFNATGDELLFCAETHPDGTLGRLSAKESRRLLSELEKTRR